jgi:hypothetical protein
MRQTEHEERWPGVQLKLRTCLDASPISDEISIMEVHGNGPAYPAQFAELPFTSVSRLLTETVTLYFVEASTTFEDR